jgi:hypothetical protein
MALFRDLSAARQPEYDAQFDRSPAWGAPVQRIEAAVGIGNLLAHRTCLDGALLRNVRRVLADPVPAVRFQVATRMLALYDKDISSLWAILDTLAREEPRIGVLSGVLLVIPRRLLIVMQAFACRMDGRGLSTFLFTLG